MSLEFVNDPLINLPVASTCSKCLKIPKYQTKEDLEKKIRFALGNCPAGFELQ